MANEDITSPPPAASGIERAAIIAAGVCVVGLLLLLPILPQTLTGRVVFAVALPLLSAWLCVRGVFRAEILRPFWLPAAAVLGLSLASAFQSMAPAYSLKAFALQALPFQGVFAGVLLWLAARPKHRRAYAWGCVASAAVVAAWTIGGYLLGFSVKEAADSAGSTYRRALGPYGSWARTSQYAVLMAPIVSAWALVLWKERQRGAALAVAFVAAALSGAMVLTQVRSAWPAWLVAMMVLLAQVRWRVAIAVCVVGACLGSLHPGVRTRLAAIPRDLSSPDTLASGRLSLWKTGLQAVREHPFLGVGYGPNIFLEDAVRAVYPLKNPSDPQRRQPDVHNVYLQQVAETGTLGAAALAFYLGVLGLAWWRGRQAPVATPEDAADRLLALGAGAGLLGLLVVGVGFNFYEERNAFLFWMVAALACVPDAARRLRGSSGSP